MKRRGPGPHVDWCGVVVRLSDGRTVALEFDGVANFVTADIVTVKPWHAEARTKTQDEVMITVHGNGRAWVEGENFAWQTQKAKMLRVLDGAPRIITAPAAIEGTLVENEKE